MELILSLIFIFLLFSHVSLRNRVSTLEEKLKDFRAPSSTVTEAAILKQSEAPLYNESTAPTFEPVTTFPPQQSFSPRPIPPAPSLQTKVEREFFLYTWFKEQTLIKIGSVIFFLGAVLFVSYAIQQNWISPLMRIFLGLLLASAVYVVGFWRHSFDQSQYQVLTVLGSGIFLGTVIASQFAFTIPVLPTAVAFFLMLLSIGYTILVAFHTKTEWLATTASVAGLLAPLLVNFNEPYPILFLTYIFFLSASLLAVVFFTSWRAVSFTLLIGSTLYLSSYYSASTIGETTLWFFVVLFSTLFCASTAISVARTNTPTKYDVTALALLTVQFAGYATTIALLPGLAFFVAATVTSFIGYALRQRGSHADAVSLFIAVSLICSLLGTAELFDGFVLTIAYALEALAIYLLTMRLATVERSIYVAAALFLLPLATGLADLTNPSWNSGILHKEALGTVSVLITLGFAVVWTLRTSALQAVDWLRQTAASLLLCWYFFAVAASIVVAEALAPGLEAVFTSTLLLSFLAGTVIAYSMKQVSYSSWKVGALFTLFAPTISAISLFTHPAWGTGISHLPFLAALLYYFGLIGVTVCYWLQAKREPGESILSTSAYALVWIVLGYGFLFLATIWDTLLSGDAERVVTSISFTFLVYLLVNGLLLARATVSKILALLATLVIPGLLLLESLRFSGWSEGILSIDAIGLYVTVTILFLLGTTFRQYTAADNNVLLHKTGTLLYVISGLLGFALVWIMSQTIFTSIALAITIALFIYTVIGLISYSYGRTQNSVTWRRVGVLLLSTVVLRLGLIDVWNMELAWKIFTFLGIGLLFIMTALFERSHHTVLPAEDKSE